jgi:hypothetical protein
VYLVSSLFLLVLLFFPTALEHASPRAAGSSKKGFHGWLYVKNMAYPKDAAPMRMKAVPSKAERARNTKKEARFGASAVARLRRRKATAVTSKTCSRILARIL